MITRIIVFLVVAVFGGLSSAWYMIERGTRMTTKTSGPWMTWTSAGRADADPYTRAHYIRRGMLPVSTALAQTYQAQSDSEGQALFSSCEYVVEGDEPSAAYWSLGVFDESGGLIPNAADRYSFNSSTVTRAPNGTLDVVLARSARPGNWLPTGGAGRLNLVLMVDEPQLAGPVASTESIRLPVIRRIGCR
jgi:hypothetical protein